MIESILILLVAALIAATMMARLLVIDEHFGHVDFGFVVEGSADAFASEQITDAIIAPDVVIDDKLFIKDGSLTILDVLVWDIRTWDVFSNYSPDVIGGEGAVQSMDSGIVADNTIEASLAPTSDALAQHTFPGGSLGTSAGSQNTRFVDRFNFFQHANEENAAGEINMPFSRQVIRHHPGYMVDDVTWFKLLTAAHYHHWIDSNATGGTQTVYLGANARRVSVDFQEVMFDRKTFLGILDAITQII